MESIERAVLAIAVLISWFVLALVVVVDAGNLPVLLPSVVLGVSLPMVWI